MQKRQILINARLTVIQIIFTNIILFVFYRFILVTLGVAQLGLWSVVFATAFISVISDLGLTGSTLKFVAKYLARNDSEKASVIIQTTILSVALFIGVIVLIAYPVVRWILKLVIAPNELRLALSLLPYALVSLWLSAVAGVAISALEGCQRFDMRVYIYLLAHLIFLLLVIWLVPTYGLYGVAYAQLLQTTFILVASWFLLRYVLPEVPLIPWRWSGILFREMLGYGINFQLISFTQLIYDPITKALLSKFGGLELIGYYEMANRLVQQARALLTSTNRVLIPVFADLQETMPQRIVTLYQNSYNLVFYVSILVYSLIFACIPAISELLLGHHETSFIIFASLLTIGWAINNLSVPAYFTFLGIGKLCWNTVGHIIIGVLNVLLGIILGSMLGGIGVVIAWVVSCILGSSFIVYMYHKEYNIALNKLLPIESRTLILIVSMGILISWITYNILYKLNFQVEGLIGSVFIYAIIIIYPFWRHSLRKKILEMLCQS